MDKRLAASLHSSAPATSGAAALPADAPAARLCHLVARPDFNGYGFRIVAGNVRSLPCVIAVEPGSPADVAGLRTNDTIVEVRHWGQLRGRFQRPVSAILWGPFHGGSMGAALIDHVVTRSLLASAASAHICRARRPCGLQASVSAFFTCNDYVNGTKRCPKFKWTCKCRICILSSSSRLV